MKILCVSIELFLAESNIFCTFAAESCKDDEKGIVEAGDVKKQLHKRRLLTLVFTNRDPEIIYAE